MKVTGEMNGETVRRLSTLVRLALELTCLPWAAKRNDKGGTKPVERQKLVS